MKRIFICTFFITMFAQSFAQASFAIHKDSNVFVGWATSAEVKRGYINISDTTQTYTSAGVTSNRATFGKPENCLGKSNGQFVSLGDGGSVVLQFSSPIINGEGYDFAVFENALPVPATQKDTLFVELGFVEVSSNGVDYARFPAVSNAPTNAQMNTFDNALWSWYENFAGVFPVFYGYPFDLDDIVDANVDVNNITYVRIIDAVGSLNPDYCTYDSQGNAVNDPFPTPFNTCGFDLDAVGVIHSADAVENHKVTDVDIFPNPASDFLSLNAEKVFSYEIIDVFGKIIISQGKLAENHVVDVSSLANGLYIINMFFDDCRIIKQFEVVK